MATPITTREMSKIFRSILLNLKKFLFTEELNILNDWCEFSW